MVEAGEWREAWGGGIFLYVTGFFSLRASWRGWWARVWEYPGAYLVDGDPRHALEDPADALEPLHPAVVAILRGDHDGPTPPRRRR
jgi:hypothetical protein